jgi:hypothetical protein
MHDEHRDARKDDLMQFVPPGMARAEHDGELMNLEDLRREQEGVPHVDLAQDIHRPPASPQEREALREWAAEEGDGGD